MARWSLGWIALGLLNVACRVSVAQAPVAQTVDPHIASVLRSLTPVVHPRGATAERFSLAERMRTNRVPGVSIAVADGGRIAWARGFGARVAGTTERVSPTTPFQAGSISKVIAATASLRLVEQGKILLDADVNQYLRSWQVPENRFTGTEKVTLRRILSHSAGVTGHSVEGYKADEALPTLIQVLDGTSPAKGEPIVVGAVPGETSRYSGGGVTIEQLLVGEVTGLPFAAALEQLVLAPLGMHDSSFEQELASTIRARGVMPYDAAGRRLPDELYVQAAAAGLWTTPSDLLTWALAIANARDGKSNSVLSRAMVRQMLTVQQKPFGLGPVLAGSARSFRFGHPGWNAGFHSELVYFPETGQGAAVMVNGDGGRAMVREVLYAIAAEYGWPDFAPLPLDVVSVDDSVLAGLVGAYAVEKPNRVTITITREGGKLCMDAPVLGARTELVFVSPTELVSMFGDKFEIVGNSSGHASAPLGVLTDPAPHPGVNPGSEGTSGRLGRTIERGAPCRLIALRGWTQAGTPSCRGQESSLAT